jgi:hypothetical protein
MHMIIIILFIFLRFVSNKTTLYSSVFFFKLKKTLYSSVFF